MAAVEPGLAPSHPARARDAASRVSTGVFCKTLRRRSRDCVLHGFHIDLTKKLGRGFR